MTTARDWKALPAEKKLLFEVKAARDQERYDREVAAMSASNASTTSEAE